MARVLAFFLIVAVVFGVGYGAYNFWAGYQAQQAGAGAMPAAGGPPGAEMMGGGGPPPEVSVVTVAPQTISLARELPGRTSAFRVAEIRPQVSGIITRRYFQEGSMIKKGAQLYQIDPAPYQATLNSAKAQLMQAEANIQALRAREQRYAELVKIGGISQQEYDDAKAALEQGEAAVAVAEAAVRTAEIDLAYTRVMAPIGGRVGKSEVTEGALVTANQPQMLAIIQQLDPIYVDVTQPSAEVSALRAQMIPMGGDGENEDKDKVAVTLVDDSGQITGAEGSLQFSDVSVDESTGMVTLRALFPNEDYAILPGLFVRARVEQGQRENAITVPQQAVLRNPDGSTIVMTVEKDGKVGIRPVTVEKAMNDDWLVSSGLAEGDQVIVEGIMKVQPGAPATAVPYKKSTTPQ